MVKKYFRPLIFAVCMMMSVSNSNLFVLAAESEMVPQSEETVVMQEQDVLSESEEEQMADESMPEDGSSFDAGNGEDQGITLDNSSETFPDGADEEEFDGNESEEESDEGSEDESVDDSEEETEEETEDDSEEETEEDETPNVSVVMTQDIENPTFADDIRQNVHVDYITASNSRLVYNIDSSLDLKKIEVGSNTYLEGGKAIVTCADGDKEIPITSEMDFSGFTGVTKITFFPKIDAYEGMTAEFTAILKLKNAAAGPGAENPISEYSCSADVIVTVNEEEKTFSASVTSKVASGSVVKPVISLDYNGKTYKESVSGAIEFGKDFELNLSKLGMSTYARPGIYTYDVTTPDFVTINHIKLPKMDGIDKISVIGFKNEKEVQFGDYASGDKVSVENSGFVGIRFVVTPAPDSTSISTSDAGKISFSNNLESNPNGKTLNASFRATAKVSVGEVEYSDSSKIITVNVKSLKRSEPEQPQTNNPGNGGGNGGNSGSGGMNEPGPTVEPTPTETPQETDNPYDKERKEEEEARKEEIKKQSLQNEQEMKEKMKSILAGRVAQITTDAVSNGGGSTSVVSNTNSGDTVSVINKKDKYADWIVKPIFETIVDNLIPDRLQPISETIIENLIPDAEKPASDSTAENNAEETETITENSTAEEKESSAVATEAVSENKDADPEKESEKKSEEKSEKKSEKKSDEKSEKKSKKIKDSTSKKK